MAARSVPAVAILLCLVAGCAQRSVTSTPPAPRAASATDSDYVYVQVTPKVIERSQPDYPEGFCAERRRARVKVMAFVLKDGTVSEARVIRSSTTRERPDPILDEAAIACVKRWRFAAAQSERGPIAVWTGVEVSWDCRNRR